MTAPDFAASPVVAIVRGIPVDRVDDVAEALLSGGLRHVEVTLNSEGALGTLARWRSTFGGLLVGAGTVLSVPQARDAVTAGAQYLLCPHTDEAIIGFAREAGVPIFPGALTPSEIVRAFGLGATAVKVFPVGSLGGPAYLRDVRAPLGHIPLMAVGGVGLDNARAYLDAGAVALGVGSALVSPDLVRAGRLDDLAARARHLVERTRKEPA